MLSIISKDFNTLIMTGVLNIHVDDISDGTFKLRFVGMFDPIQHETGLNQNPINCKVLRVFDTVASVKAKMIYGKKETQIKRDNAEKLSMNGEKTKTD